MNHVVCRQINAILFMKWQWKAHLVWFDLITSIKILLFESSWLTSSSLFSGYLNIPRVVNIFSKISSVSLYKQTSGWYLTSYCLGRYLPFSRPCKCSTLDDIPLICDGLRPNACQVLRKILKSCWWWRLLIFRRHAWVQKSDGDYVKFLRERPAVLSSHFKYFK